MLKFAKNFFIVFLITTIVPLAMMFFWNHHQMEKFVNEKEQRLIDFESNKLSKSVENYLKIRQSIILEKILFLPEKQMTSANLRHILQTDRIIFSKNKIGNLKTYYKNINSELYNITEVPYFATGYNSIQVIEKVDLAQLHPGGFFDIEVYIGDKISKHSLLDTIKDPMDMNSPPRPHPNFPMEKRVSRNIKVYDDNNNVIAILILKSKHMPMPPRVGGRPPFPPHDGRFAPNPPGNPPLTGMTPPPFAERPPPENIFGLLILFVGSTLSLITGFYISKNFVNPLLVLSDALKKVKDGNLSFEINTKIKQEQIQDIFNNFNDMIKGLKEKDLLRKSFITSLTHDLKTPLIAQERSLGLISKEFEELGMEKAHQLAKGIEKNNAHLLRMVDLILESYRFEFEKLTLNMTKMNLSELIGECYEKLGSLAEEKNIELINSIPVDLPAITADETSIKRIFLNLISNSIDNMLQSGKVEINAVISDKFLTIRVKDNGAGISEKDMQHIFERYYTGKSDERKIGSGLGLFVCRKLVEMHNGEISVTSEMNRYTEFVIKLPI